MKTFLALVASGFGLVASLRAQPVITGPPTDKTVRVGETAFFTVTASGAPPLTYQWRKDGAEIPGATGYTLALGLARDDMVGSYSVVANNPGGSVTSASPAVLLVEAAASGAAVAWGDNEFRQTLVPPAAQGGVTAVAAGWRHSAALTSSGSVLVWGDNAFGKTNVPVAAQSGVAAIAAGGHHMVALRADGSVVAWGFNSRGQKTVPAAAQSGVVAVAAGEAHTVALKMDGSVIAWGWNAAGQATVPAAAQSRVAAVAAGNEHTVALKIDGSVVVWGNNGGGQATVPLAAQGGVVAIAAGGDNSVALTSGGSIVAWGDNSRGQTTVPVEAQSGVVAIAAGGLHTVALRADGSVVAWGDNLYGQAPGTVGLTAATAIAAGAFHTIAVAILTTPVIVTPPMSQTVNAGQSLSFSVTVTGLSLTYQWRKDGTNLAGATNATYGLSSVRTNHTGDYSVIVSNSAGSVTSAPPASLTVIPTPPVILMPPASLTVNLGQSASFTVTAAGYALSYQWRRNDVNIPGATNATYLMPTTRTEDAVDYTVVVSNPDGSVTSAPPAVLTLTTFPPEILIPPTNLTVNAGQTASFTVVAAFPPFTYQWRKDGVDILVATGATCAFGLVRTNQAGSYTVVVSNPVGSVTSAPPALLTVLPAEPRRAAGPVIAWGYNDFGQTAVPPAAQRGVAAIAAGGSHTIALKTDGSVVAWGFNGFGQTTVPLAAQGGMATIAAGGSHMVALKHDGSVVAWGNNGTGQTNVPVTARSGVAAIAAGGDHTVALKNDGSVVAWGDNGNGQTNVPVAAQSGVVAIAAGGSHTVALTTDGSVVAWGDNGWGQTTVPVAAQSGVAAIAAGRDHTVALKNDGSVVAWGDNGSGETTVPLAAQSGVAAIAAGSNHTVALKNDGSVVAWGHNFFGQSTVPVAAQSGVLAIAAGSIHTVAIVAPTIPTITTPPASQTVAVGDTVTFAVDAAAFPSLTYQWQFNGADIPGATDRVLQLVSVTRSQAGRYTVVASNEAGSVTSDAATLTVNFVVQFSAARSGVSETGHVATIRVSRAGDGPEAVTVNYATSDGTATAGQDYMVTSGTISFGPGEVEQAFTVPILDDVFPEGAEHLRLSLSGLTGPAVFGATINAQLTILDDEQSSSPSTRARPVIAAATSHTVALKADGSLWAWGENGSGQLGLGLELGPGTNAPAQIGSDHDWMTVAAGWNHTLAVKSDGSLWAWGNNCSGQLGVDSDCAQNSGLPVRVGADAGWLMVAAGDSHSVGLRTDGSLWAWGSFNGTNKPAPIGLDLDWAWIGAGWNRALAVKQDGTLWELNPNGATPVGTDNDWDMVVTAGGQEDWSSTSDAVALKSDGSLWSWGGNGYGQLGDGTTIFRDDPAPVGADVDWAAIAAAYHHTLALKSDGSLWAWGENSFGKLGLGADSGPNQLYPALVGADNTWVAIAAGREFSVGLKIDGSLWGWGFNGSGQLGLGGDSNPNVNVPTRIGTANDWAQPSTAPINGEFRITAQSINPDLSRTLYFTHTNSRAYYILLRGPSLTNISQPADLALASRHSSMTDRTPQAANATLFYRLRAVPRAQPLDLDRDGIDDYYELRHGTFLNPLNSADAAQDHDGDGYSNLSEYRAGTDPTQYTARRTIAAGNHYTVLLKADGSLWMMGESPATNSTVPVRFGADTDWLSVAVTRDCCVPSYLAALKRDGSLWVGNGSGMERVGNDRNWTDLSAGGNWLALVKADGSLWNWNGGLWRIGEETIWRTVAAGGAHTLALKTDGSLWAWGDNQFGQLGLGENAGAGEPARVGSDHDWIAIAASGDTDVFNGAHSLALKADGSLWAWGHNDWGQLGLGFTGYSTNNFTPARVGTNNDWAAITVSDANSLARKVDGSLWIWGYHVAEHPVRVGTNYDWTAFALGGVPNASQSIVAVSLKSDGSLWSAKIQSTQNVPTPIGMDSDWTRVTAGTSHTLALKTNGTAWSWGANWAGQLGDGTMGTSRYSPVVLGGTTDWSAMAAGAHHSIGLQADGSIWAWGNNYNGQLGDGTLTNRNSPIRVGFARDWTFVAAGEAHTAALKSDGSLWSWGWNSFGQLGDGTTNDHTIPTRVGTDNDWVAAAANLRYTLALKSEGSLWAWGANDEGQLGDGTTINRISPVRIGLDHHWADVEAGYNHTLALRGDGTLWAWGRNGAGQLGDGTSLNQSNPIRIGTDTDWAAIAAGSDHNLALKTDGSLWAWGWNYFGQLGGGTWPIQSTPIRIGLDADWASITAGGNHSLARKTDGTLWSWGLNEFGQLGIAADVTPRRVGNDSDWGAPP